MDWNWKIESPQLPILELTRIEGAMAGKTVRDRMLLIISTSRKASMQQLRNFLLCIRLSFIIRRFLWEFCAGLIRSVSLW